MKISAYDIYSSSHHQYKKSYELKGGLIGNVQKKTNFINPESNSNAISDTSLSLAAHNKYRSSSFSQMDKAIKISKATRKTASQQAEKQIVSRLVSHATSGKVSFTQEDIMANIKPIKSIGQNFLSSPMGGSIKISAMRTETTHEIESTFVNTQGVIETQDGRQIQFAMHLSMEREFMSEKTSLEEVSTRQLVDPLVIQFEDGAPSLSDKVFSFDLTGDGKKETLHALGKGSGFLAFDSNGDGKINDGTELFGTKSGNGFADLAKYDEDGNGWIDENDSIFSKLSVWRPGTDGQQEYSKGLLDSNVGAIFLGQTKSEHTLNDAKGNTKGLIKSTGMFVKETGDTGHIFQMDLANVKNSNELNLNNGTEQTKGIDAKENLMKKKTLAIVKNLIAEINISLDSRNTLLNNKQEDSIFDINKKMQERMDKLMSMLLFPSSVSQIG